jgi:hypothetical protein
VAVQAEQKQKELDPAPWALKEEAGAHEVDLVRPQQQAEKGQVWVRAKVVAGAEVIAKVEDEEEGDMKLVLDDWFELYVEYEKLFESPKVWGKPSERRKQSIEQWKRYVNQEKGAHEAEADSVGATQLFWNFVFFVTISVKTLLLSF